MQGHNDWVFDAAWVGPTTLMSASRDKSVRFWHLPADLSGKDVISTPVHAETWHQQGVRAASSSKSLRLAGTLGSGGKIHLRDAGESFAVV